MPRLDDPFPSRQAQLEADGWIFYETQRYDPTVISGYTTMPDFLGGSPANRRRGNRPVFVSLIRTTPLDTDPWQGIINMGQTSALNPWVTGATMPPDEADWAVGPTAHYIVDTGTGSVNPEIENELATVRPDWWFAQRGTTRPRALNIASTVTRSYGNCSDPDTAVNAIRDLFGRTSV